MKNYKKAKPSLFAPKSAGEKFVGKKTFLQLLSTHFLICNEKIETRGEDSALEIYTAEAGLLGVFDGCGGLGSKTVEAISDKTEAYLASRSIGNAAIQWFNTSCNAGHDWNIDRLKELILTNLSVCRRMSGEPGIRLRGSLFRPYPSTIAAVAFRISEEGLECDHIWAGDSRTFVMDKSGLAQISVDDISDGDAMSNLTNDGALTNVLSEDGNFVIHRRKLTMTEPCLVFASSDGCFQYVHSPMEFEWMVLSSLMEAASVDEWHRSLNDMIEEISGDDQSLGLAAFGFEKFSDLKTYFKARYKEILAINDAFNNGGTDQQQQLWLSYKPNYYRFEA